MIERRFFSFLVASSYCFVILACVFLYKLGMEGLGPIDDHQFIRTVFQGKDFGSYILPELGRFLPFTAQEYVFISKFIGPSPFLFHFCGAVKILLVGVLFFYCLCLTGIKKIFLPVFWSVGVLSIGLANSGFRLQVGEINALILILMFLVSVLLSMREGLSRLTICSLLVIGTISFSMALFYKETIFSQS